MCAPKMQKRLEKNQSAGNEPEDKEKKENNLINPVKHIRRAIAKHLKTKKYVTIGGKK